MSDRCPTWITNACGEWMEEGCELRQTDGRDRGSDWNDAAEVVRSIRFGVWFEGGADRIC